VLGGCHEIDSSKPRAWAYIAAREEAILGLVSVDCWQAPVKLSVCHDLLIAHPQQLA
jgi:hypothetical protein